MKALYRLVLPASVAILATLPSTHSAAQSMTRPIVIGEELTLHSEILKEDRVIYVGKPDNYDQGDERYPVMIVLDGDTHFHHTTGVTTVLARNQIIPRLLVIGIGNTARARDMTPPARDPTVIQQVPTQGGAAEFRAFIADELMPWLDNRYRTHPYKILVGHSLGGLFAIDSLITRPELFDAYIAISPSLQWDKQRLVERAEAFFDDQEKLDVSLFMTTGNEGGELAGGVRKLSGLLEEKAPAGLAWRFEPMPQETHGTVPLRSTYDGLEFIFADWTLRDPFDTYNKYGFEAIERFFAASDAKYRLNRGVPESVMGPLAVQLENAGRLDEIMEMLARARAKGHPQPPPRFVARIADRYVEAGRPEKAIEAYRQVLETDPNNEAARQALEKLTRRNP